MRRFLLSFLSLSSAACAAPLTATTAPVAPPATTTAAAPAAGPDVFALDGTLREEWMPLLKAPLIDPAATRLAPAPSALPAAPSSCDAFVARTATSTPSCASTADALAALDVALGNSDPAQRDTALVALEGCAGLPGGVARALRAEHAPIECGEAIVAQMLSAPPRSISGSVYHALFGQAVASRLARAATGAPTLAPPFTRVRVVDFTTGPIRAWFVEQALVIQEVSRMAVELPQYAKGITAIEAGVAEMRLVDVVRSAPLPEEMAKDAELRNHYYGTLDQGLDPRKDRGRDAALVGLREMALVGAIHDPRVDRARTLLSRLYGGRRIDALDALLLPPLPAATPTTVEERLARSLPTFYAGLLLDEHAASRPGTLRMLLEKGVPLPHRNALRTDALTPAARDLYARARLELGRLYWRAVDFDQAAAVVSTSPAGTARSDEATFVLALAIALRNGPDDATAMMHKAPLALSSLGKIQALDFVASPSQKSRYAGFAAFDAALIRQLAAPENADATFWRDVATRFHAAAALLGDGKQKAVATERARAAEQMAAAVK